ncbi:DUF4910 domain-containing protein [Kosmotoga pacifica]|uniref:Peptidase M28 domain-containing protein n=1 Tax=Kosmotoga pacifica TaxID=1330330 RepID=A0A0G2Z5F7_9BACT|nr:DUF4910 domain-containing protein [Kosmotoga pacifica]AKI96802.1 hypothetical protein IX53_02055 [Kosmotoga pacifica]
MFINGKSVKSLIELISGYTRSRGSASYRELLEKLIAHLVASGVPSDSIYVKEYACDGKTRYGNFTSTMIWEPVSAELWISKPKEMFITSLRNSPNALLFGSAPTGGRVELPLVEYEGPGDYSGKAVLAKEHPMKLFKETVVKSGAKAIIVSYMRGKCPEIGREPESNPNVVNYLSIPSTQKDFEYGAFGFSVSEKKYNLLKEHIKGGNAWITAEVDVKVSKGSLQVLEIDLTRGSHMSYALITAHLCHPYPGANDNASGAALAVEIAKIVALSEGFPPIKIVLLPEFYGSAPYVLELKKNHELPSLSINLDMVGEDQTKTGSSMLLTETPPVLPKRFDFIIEYFLLKNIRRCDGIPVKKYYRIPYSAGSDHSVFSAMGISSPFLGHLPDRFYHTDADNLDKVDCGELEWIGNSVLESLQNISSPRLEVDLYVKSKAISEFVFYCEKMKEKPGSKELFKVFLQSYEAVKYGFSSLYSENAFISSVTPLLPKFEGSIGFDWLSDLPEGILKPLKQNVTSLAELITVVANIIGSRESAELFASIYYDLPQDKVSEFVQFLIDKGYFVEGEF